MINDRVIWKPSLTMKPFRIPDGYVKCKKCLGVGQVIKIYHDPGPNEYVTCFVCDGKGFVANQVRGEKNR